MAGLSGHLSSVKAEAAKCTAGVEALMGVTEGMRGDMKAGQRAQFAQMYGLLSDDGQVGSE